VDKTLYVRHLRGRATILNETREGFATLKPTKFAKKRMAEALFFRGCNFVAAAVLLRQKGGYDYVVLHLLCQGVEIILKSLLLLQDYDQYRKVIKDKMGHDLEKLIKEVSSEYGSTSFRGNIVTEIKELNGLYKAHLLRYGGNIDILIDPKTIKSNLTLKKITQVVRVVRRGIARDAE
jgi:HEPN domain-containing protein